ncbi:MAG: HAMP domain-containing protein [Lachnospiraceae bacterium]|nr:HAMP domain-containing protein [Lachnospiraceae bacterium]
MKNSIRTRLILILTIFLVVFVLLNIVMNVSFLENYYSFEKEKVLGNIYEQVYKICRADSESEDYFTKEDVYYRLDALAANNGLNLYVFSTESDGIFNYYNFKFPNVESDTNSYKIINEQLNNYVNDYYGFSALMDNYKLIKSNDRYSIYKVYDDRIQSNYLELFGRADKNTFIFLRANYQNVKDSVYIANRFITFIGVIAVIVGAVAMFYIGRNFTKPVLLLAGIADKMANLDFDAKYDEDRDDEIGRLGNSMNVMSNKLQAAITELKIANNELQRDIEKKEQIDIMRQEFLSNVSHELKTPIALIQGYAEGLADDVSDNPEDRKFYCDVIIDESHKMNRMVKRLLNLNQLEFGSEKPDLKRFNIVEVIKSVVSASDIMFKQNDITLDMYEPSPVYVWADEYLVEEVLTNYISNALNHVNEHGRISVFTKKYGDVVRISVHNTGENIPDEDIDRIWEKFYKVDKARTREYGGNGIGLSIVKAIMKGLNSECGVINDKNGVEFWFELDISVD